MQPWKHHQHHQHHQQVNLEVDYSAEITANSVTTVPGGRFYFVVDTDKALTGTVDDYAVFSYYLIDNVSGMKSAVVSTLQRQLKPYAYGRGLG